MLHKGYYTDHFDMTVDQGIRSQSDILIYFQIEYNLVCMVLLWFRQGMHIYDFLLRLSILRLDHMDCPGIHRHLHILSRGFQ